MGRTVYVPTFTINLSQMYRYIYNKWILWVFEVDGEDSIFLDTILGDLEVQKAEKNPG